MKTTINQNKGEDKPKRRLTNFRIKEVSLVDAAANGTEFLVIKSKSAEQKDAEIFNKTTVVKTDTTTTQKDATTKNVEPLTFAMLVLGVTEMQNKFNSMVHQVKGLTVSENGQFNMGPEITGHAVSLLEELSKMLFMFGSDSTLGFDGPVAMSKSIMKAIGLDTVEVEKVGRAMSAQRLDRIKESVKSFEKNLKEMKSLVNELETKKEDTMTEAEKKAKEADLKKRVSAEAVKIRKELGLPEEGEKSAEEIAAEEKAASDKAASDKQEEVAKLKQTIADLEKKIAAPAAVDPSKEVAELTKRLKVLETASSNAAAVEETEIEKNKKKTEDKPEFIEKNGRQVKKGLFSGLAGVKMSDVLNANSGKKY